MKELNSPIKFNVPYQTTTLLSSVALGRTTNIHGLHASWASQDNLQPLQPRLPFTKIKIEKNLAKSEEKNWKKEYLRKTPPQSTLYLVSISGPYRWVYHHGVFGL